SRPLDQKNAFRCSLIVRLVDGFDRQGHALLLRIAKSVSRVAFSGLWMSEITLRKLSGDDLPRVIEILSYWNMAPVGPTAAVPIPETTGLEPERTTLAIVQQNIVGVASYILLENGWAETTSLAVDPAWLGHGIGEKLQIARLKEMKMIGIQNVKTECDR